MRNKKVFIALSIFCVMMVAGVITLGVLFGRNNKKIAQSNALLEGQYQQAYYVLLDETNDMEIKFAKLRMSSSPTRQAQLLREVVTAAEVASNALAALSSRDITVEYTMKFINQTGGFAAFLVDTLEDGQTLSEEQRESIAKIHEMLGRLGAELAEVQDRLNDGYLFVDGANDASGVLSGIFSELNDASVEYPQLIFDGPFSDALNDRETKGLSGEDITEEQGREILDKIFSDSSLSDVRFLGEWSSDIPSLNYSATVNGLNTTVQLAKQGGMVISINAFREVTNPILTEDECAELGKQFLQRLGFEDMTVVWVCNDDSTVFVNYAPTAGGVILYPDLIKLKIASDKGNILGMEATNYAFNHTVRTIDAAQISADEARKKLSVTENVTGGRLCLIPYKTNAERLAYEFVAEEGGTYYIYIDAVTGEEIEILYVVSTIGGDMLV